MYLTVNKQAFSKALSQIFGCTPQTGNYLRSHWDKSILRAIGDELHVEVDTNSVSLRATLQVAVSIIEEGSVSLSTIDLIRSLQKLEDVEELSVFTIPATDLDSTMLTLQATEKIFVKLPVRIELYGPEPEVVAFDIERTDLIACARVASYHRDGNALYAIHVRTNSLSAICELNGIALVWQKQGINVAKTTSPTDLVFYRPELVSLIDALSLNSAKILKCEKRKGVQTHLSIDAGYALLHFTIPRKHDKELMRLLPHVAYPRPYRFVLTTKAFLSIFEIDHQLKSGCHNAKTYFRFDHVARTLLIETKGNGSSRHGIRTIDSIMPEGSMGIFEVSFLSRRLRGALKFRTNGEFVQMDFRDERTAMRVSFNAKDRACDEVWTRNDELLTRERMVIFCAVLKPSAVTVLEM